MTVGRKCVFQESTFTPPWQGALLPYFSLTDAKLLPYLVGFRWDDSPLRSAHDGTRCFPLTGMFTDTCRSAQLLAVLGTQISIVADTTAGH